MIRSFVFSRLVSDSLRANARRQKSIGRDRRRYFRERLPPAVALRLCGILRRLRIRPRRRRDELTGRHRERNPRLPRALLAAGLQRLMRQEERHRGAQAYPVARLHSGWLCCWVVSNEGSRMKKSVSGMKPPIRRNTLEVDVAWLEEAAEREGATEARASAPPPPRRPSRIPKRPPALAGAASRHHTMEVKAEWLEAGDDAARRSPPPLPVEPVRAKRAMVPPIPRTEEDDPPRRRSQPPKRPSR